MLENVLSRCYSKQGQTIPTVHLVLPLCQLTNKRHFNKLLEHYGYNILAEKIHLQKVPVIFQG